MFLVLKSKDSYEVIEDVEFSHCSPPLSLKVAKSLATIISGSGSD